jgi:hypothetical protein
MYIVGYNDPRDGFVTMGQGPSIRTAMCDCASALTDDKPVNDIFDALTIVQSLCSNMDVDLVVRFAEEVQKDAIAMYLQP